MDLAWIPALAAAGGGALLSAAATDAWAGAKHGVLKIFGRDGQHTADAVARRLEEDAAAIEAAGVEERDAVRERLLPSWQTRLSDLLRDHPEAREELQAWADRVRAEVPADAQTWTQHVDARGHAHAYGAQGPAAKIEVHHHGTAAPGDTGEVVTD